MFILGLTSSFSDLQIRNAFPKEQAYIGLLHFKSFKKSKHFDFRRNQMQIKYRLWNSFVRFLQKVYVSFRVEIQLKCTHQTSLKKKKENPFRWRKEQNAIFIKCLLHHWKFELLLVSFLDNACLKPGSRNKRHRCGGNCALVIINCTITSFCDVLEGFLLGCDLAICPISDF